MSRRKKSSKNPQPVRHSESHLSVSHASFSGPIPPPALLEGYEAILPGSAERILALAEGEAIHRREIEKKFAAAEIRLAKGEHYQVYLGQLFAFVIAIGFIVGGVFLIYHGKQVSGTIVSATALIAVVTAFLKSRQKQ